MTLEPVFGIDPSINGTACALVGFGPAQPVLLNLWTLFPTKEEDAVEAAIQDRAARILVGVADCYAQARAQVSAAGPQKLAVAIEIPDNPNAMKPYTSKKGGQRFRPFTPPANWCLIGGLVGHFTMIGAPQVWPSPAECKNALGAASKAEVASRIQLVVQKADLIASLRTKPEREAVSDAAAAALAGYARFSMNKRLRQIQESVNGGA